MASMHVALEHTGTCNALPWVAPQYFTILYNTLLCYTDTNIKIQAMLLLQLVPKLILITLNL